MASPYALGQPITVVEGDLWATPQTVGTLTVNDDSTWTFDPNPNLDNSDDMGMFGTWVRDTEFSFTIKATDADGDRVSDSQTITVLDGTNPPLAGTISLALDEEALGNTNATGTNPTSGAEQVSNTLSFTAGSDDLSGFRFSTNTNSLLRNTDGVTGNELTWVRDSATQITGHFGSSGGAVAITLALSAPSSIANGTTGTVTVTATLSDNLKHALANGEQSLDLGYVRVYAYDHDGDSTYGTVNLSVTDDVPTLTVDADAIIVDNSQFSNLVVNGSFENITGQQVSSAGGNGSFIGDSQLPADALVNLQSMEGWQLMSPTSTWIEPHNKEHVDLGAVGENYMDLGESTHSPVPGTYNANTHIGQIIGGLQDNTNYTLSFSLIDKAWSQGMGDASGKMEVLWNGAVVATYDGTTSWVTQTLTLNSGPEGSSHRLEFREIGTGNDNGGMAIDSVSMVAQSITYIVDGAVLNPNWGADGKPAGAGYEFGTPTVGSGWTLSAGTLVGTNVTVAINANTGTLTVTQTGPLSESVSGIPVVIRDADGDLSATQFVSIRSETPEPEPMPEFWVKVTGVDSVTEGGVLVHQVTLVDADGNEVRVPAGEWVQVRLDYEPYGSDGAETNDYAPQTLVRIYGGTSGTFVFNQTTNDTVSEGDEMYRITASVNEVSDPTSMLGGGMTGAEIITGTILDNDLPPPLIVGDNVGDTGDTGTPHVVDPNQVTEQRRRDRRLGRQ